MRKVTVYLHEETYRSLKIMSGGVMNCPGSHPISELIRTAIFEWRKTLPVQFFHPSFEDLERDRKRLRAKMDAIFSPTEETKPFFLPWEKRQDSLPVQATRRKK
jgi:hypothetical protein